MARQGQTRAFTLLETTLAFAILAVGMLAMYLTMSRAAMLSETNKQIKTAVLHARALAEEVSGTNPFEGIMNPYPNADYTYTDFNNLAFTYKFPRFHHMQWNYISRRLFGVDTVTKNPNPGYLTDEKIRIWFGARLDTNDVNQNGDTTDAEPFPLQSQAMSIMPNYSSYSQTIAAEEARAPIVWNSLLSNYSGELPANSPNNIAQFQPADGPPPLNTPGRFVTPDPLYCTVEVSWIGPGQENSSNPIRMTQRLTFVISRSGQTF